MIRAYNGVHPKLGKGVFVDTSAQVIGDVELGDHSSIWMNAVVRGDVNAIRIGEATNVQDNCVIHVQGGEFATEIADHVTIGHGVVLHGCRIEPRCLIGIRAVVLNGATVGAESIIAAGTLVPEGATIPPRSLVMGSPGRVKRSLTETECAALKGYAENYLQYKETYLSEQERSGEVQ
jgi:carbonic anhydrase/acetyltransferase-like protein (isoleucine patch superfamily)